MSTQSTSSTGTGQYRVAVIGATGAVGRVMLAKLRERDFPASEIVPFASARSAGTEIEGFGTVQPLSEETVQGFDLAIFSAGASTSGEWAQRFVAAGAIVVDNSSRFRRDDDIPLVVAEVNPEALERHSGIIANPNCSTMQLMVALKPIYDAVGIERLVVSTYQCVSGTGRAAVDELLDQTHAELHGMELPQAQIYPHPIAFNVLGGAGNFPDGDDYTDEERKMMFETRKILGDQSIGISVTCARVPVTYSHSESVNVQTREPITIGHVREVLESAPGLVVVDDPRSHSYPTAREAAGRDEVFVGRLRADESHPRAFNMWVVSDNLLKGAATNAIQIAEVLHERGLLKARAAVQAPSLRRSHSLTTRM